MVMMNKMSKDDAILELEQYIRETDGSLSCDVLQALEVCAEYSTYEKVRKAACLIREAMNELYEESLKIKGEK
jgi:L-fucose mutarotase/ribose pyranase (RbsD/FucU family)